MLLNRTNLTLSALALSNGLNLGTRSFAVDANVSNGDQTLRIRQVHHDVMRERMVWYVVSSIPKPSDANPAIPSSFFPRRPQRPGCLTLPRGYVEADSCVEPDTRPANLVERDQPGVFDREVSFKTIVPITGNLISGATTSKSHPGLKSSGIHGWKATAGPAARATAAPLYANSGK
jgi:hypothetical protein